MSRNEFVIDLDEYHESPREGFGQIYGLVHPQTGVVRYVGQTKHSLKYRISRHITSAARVRETAVHRWIMSLLDNEVEPQIVPIETQIPTEPFSLENQSKYIRNELDAAERFWIEFYRRKNGSLLNITDGGMGMSGRKITGPWSGVTGEDHPSYQKEWPQEVLDKKSSAMKRFWEKVKSGEVEYPFNRSSQSNLSWPDVKEIRDRHQNGEKQTELAQEFDVSKATIHRIVHYKAWVPYGEDIPETKIWESQKGNRNAARLTWEDVEEIRRRYEESDDTWKDIAQDYDCSASNIGRIVNYETWIPEDYEETDE